MSQSNAVKHARNSQVRVSGAASAGPIHVDNDAPGLVNYHRNVHANVSLPVTLHKALPRGPELATKIPRSDAFGP